MVVVGDVVRSVDVAGAVSVTWVVAGATVVAAVDPPADGRVDARVVVAPVDVDDVDVAARP